MLRVTGSNLMSSTICIPLLIVNRATIFHQDDKKQWVKNHHSWRWSVRAAFQRGALERGTTCFI